jgi:hypothetical protein
MSDFLIFIAVTLYHLLVAFASPNKGQGKEI